MSLGEKLKQARLELGLSQRQLCGEAITRNMLSQIENGSARPSMDTLQFLAQRLGKPLGYFLDDSTVSTPNLSVMEKLRAAWISKAYRQMLEELASYDPSNDSFAPERWLWHTLVHLALADQAISDGKLPYAQHLLEQIDTASPYAVAELERKRLTLLAEAGADTALPSLDRELLLRAKLAETPHRAAQLLDAAEDQTTPQWNFLRGKVYWEQSQFQLALNCLKAAEDAYPRETASLLEHCCRELEDFKGAYYYACKLREYS